MKALKIGGMKNLSTYEQWLITESNKTVEYFRQNPGALSNFAGTLQPHHKHADYDPKKSPSWSNEEFEATEKIQKIARMKLFKIGGETGELQAERAFWKWSDLIVGSLSGWSDWWDSRELRQAIIDSRNFKDFMDVASASTGKYRSWRFPGEDYGKGYTPDNEIVKPFYNWIGGHFEDIQDICKWLNTALENVKNLREKRADREFLKLGLSYRDIKIAMSYVKEWTSMSRKKLDPEAWPLLQKISVDSSTLPRYVYRGIFYDGAKIKNLEKWSKQWFPGAKPGASQGKATSWTIDRKTAISFMIDQDFIKDVDKGYYMLLKLRVDPRFVIADLRNLPVDHTFWNQQELIISPEATDYEVDTMIPGSDGVEAFREFARSNQGGQGASGRTKASFAMEFMNTPYETVSPGMRMEFKQICKMTVDEFRKAYPDNHVNSDYEWGKIAMPIFNYMSRYNSKMFITSAERNEVKFKVFYRMEDLDYSQNPNLKSAYKNVKEKYEFNQFAGTNLIQSNEGSIRLINDDYYNIDLEINLPTEFSIQPKEGNEGKDPREMDVQTNKALEEIFNELGSDEFLKTFHASQIEIQRRIPKNINIDIK